MNRVTEETIERLVWVLTEAMAPDMGKALATLKALVNFKPGVIPTPIKGYGISKKEMAEVPFFSETFLYAVLGKEDARTLLGRLRRVCEALGFDMEKLYEEE